MAGVVAAAADSLKLTAPATAPNPTTAMAALAAAMCLMFMALIICRRAWTFLGTWLGPPRGGSWRAEWSVGPRL